MDCAICGVRSSVGYCEECKTLLCEECAIKCETCGKLICLDHVHVTSSQRQLCGACHQERKARRARRGPRSDEARKPAGAVPGEEEEEAEAEEERVLVVSARRVTPPWKVSMYVAIAGVVLVLLTMVAPGFRRIVLSGSGYISLPYFLLIFPVFAVGWAALGWYTASEPREKAKCFIGAGIALVSVVLSVVSALTDPARTVDEQSLLSDRGQGEKTAEEMKQYRSTVLEQYGGATEKPDVAREAP